MTYSFYIPTRVLFGPGTLNSLSEQKLPGKKALIAITEGGSMKRNGYLARVEEQLRQAGCGSAVYGRIQPNPTKDSVMEGAQLGKDQDCDFVVGLGGGSAIDAAKAIAIMMTNPGDYWDYIHGGTAKGKPFEAKPLPVVAIVTTAGTGTEADPWTVVTKTETKEKVGFGCDDTFPVLSIVDAELMLSIPEKLTAYQGLDALFHSTEGYVNRNVSDVSDMFCEKSIELLGRSLVRAVQCGSDLEARNNVAMASMIAGYVQSTSGCVSQHSLAHAMGAIHPEIPHGAALTAISCAYFGYLAEQHACDDRMIRMAKLLGKEDASEAMDFVRTLAEIEEACGVSKVPLSEYGFTEEEFSEIAQNARETMGGNFGNDRVEVSDQVIVDIFSASFR